MKQKKYLALDIGTKTIGLASSRGYFASPKTTLRFQPKAVKTALHRIAQLCQLEGYTDLVVGYPLNDDNTFNQQTKYVDNLLKMLQADPA